MTEKPIEELQRASIILDVISKLTVMCFVRSFTKEEIDQSFDEIKPSLAENYKQELIEEMVEAFREPMLKARQIIDNE